MKKKLVFIVFTSSFKWGKGTDIITAMKNAKVKMDDKLKILAVETTQPGEVSINESGAICHPKNSKVFNCTDEKREVRISELISMETMYEKVIDHLEERGKAGIAERLYEIKEHIDWEKEAPL